MKTDDFKIFALGDWQARDLVSQEVTTQFSLTANQLESIESCWKSLSSKKGVHLFDGPMCRLESYSAEKNRFSVAFSRTTYKFFVGTHFKNPHWADVYGSKAMANPIGVSVILQSSSGDLVFGQRSNRVAIYPGCIHPIGGGAEPPSPGKSLDLVGDMLRELTQEAQLNPSEIAPLRLIGLLEDLFLKQPQLIFYTSTTLPTNTLIERLLDDEHSGSWVLSDRESHLSEKVNSIKNSTPVLRGALLAWGNLKFGRDWLKEHLHGHEPPVNFCE